MDTATARVGMVEITIVHGTNKALGVSKVDSIDAVKVLAMGLYGIPESEKANFILQAKIHGNENEQLDEAKTVEDYHLHNNQKVVLASGTPFGS